MLFYSCIYSLFLIEHSLKLLETIAPIDLFPSLGTFFPVCIIRSTISIWHSSSGCLKINSFGVLPPIPVVSFVNVVEQYFPPFFTISVGEKKSQLEFRWLGKTSRIKIFTEICLVTSGGARLSSPLWYHVPNTRTIFRWPTLDPSDSLRTSAIGCFCANSRRTHRYTRVFDGIGTVYRQPVSRTEPTSQQNHENIYYLSDCYIQSIPQKERTSTYDILCSSMERYNLFSNLSDCMWFMYRL